MEIKKEHNKQQRPYYDIIDNIIIRPVRICDNIVCQGSCDCFDNIVNKIMMY